MSVGEIEGFGESGAEPGGGFDGIHLAEGFAVVERGGIEGGGQRTGAVDDRE